jgi:hypothetical protein
MRLFQSVGRLNYATNKLVVEADQGISDFYRSLIPKYHRVQRQFYPAHISVVRKELPPKMQFWREHQDEQIEFAYEPYQQNDETYWWLNVFCVRLEEIRLELGLPVSSPYTLPPSGFAKCFHMTIGNTKGT